MGVSFEEMMKSPAPKTTLSFEEMQAADPAPEGSGWDAAKAFGDRVLEAGKSLRDVAEAMKTRAQESAAKGSTPIGILGDTVKGTLVGAVKAVVGGGHSLGELSVAGVYSLVENPFREESFSETVNSEMAKGERARKATEALIGVNLAPETKEEEAMSKLLMLLPEGIHAVGATIYEKTGWAVAGAGAEALLTFLMLKPSTAAKSLTKAAPRGTPRGGNKVAAAFDELAATQPEKAQALADHVSPADKMLGELMNTRIEELKGATPEKLKEVGEASIVEPQPLLDEALRKLEETKARTVADFIKQTKELPDVSFSLDTETELWRVYSNTGPDAPNLIGSFASKAEAQKLTSEWKPGDLVAEIHKTGEGEHRVVLSIDGVKSVEQTFGSEKAAKKYARQRLDNDKKMKKTVTSQPETVTVGNETFEISKGEKAFNLNYLGEHGLDMPELLGQFPTANMAKAYIEEITASQKIAESKRLGFRILQGGKGVIERVPPAEAKLGEYPTLPTDKAKITELNKRIRPLAEKENLTAAEAKQFRDLVNQRATVVYRGAKPATDESLKALDPKMSTLSKDIYKAASVDALKNEQIYKALADHSAGAEYNADTAVDRIMRGDNPDITAEELYQAFEPTRNALRAQYGNTVTLYRAEGKQKQKLVSNWATTEKFARQFGESVVKKEVPVDNVLAVQVTRNGGYHELIVGQPPKSVEAIEATQAAKVAAEDGISSAAAEVSKAADTPSKENATPPGMDDPTLYLNMGVPVTLSQVKNAFDLARKYVPGAAFAEGKLRGYWDSALKTFAPESISPEARRAGAIIASRVAEQGLSEHMIHGPSSATRRIFWNQQPEVAQDFIRNSELGKQFPDPAVQKAAEGYKAWNQKLNSEETRLGLSYDPIENYLYHVYENGPAAQRYFEQRYGIKWGDPAFVKDRMFATYAEAIDAGLKPKFSNPEDIMLARQHAHEVARTKVEIFRELEQHGLATMVKKGEKVPPEGFAPAPRRSPNGDHYWVHQGAENIIKNLYDTKSLWSAEGWTGDAFRGAMYLKNTITPIILSASGFHGLHVLTIDNATAMVRSTKELLSGVETPANWMARMAKAGLYLDLIENPMMGGRINKIIKGKLPESEWTAGDRVILQTMMEGGFVPLMSHKYRTAAIRQFQDAVARRSVGVVAHAIPAAIQLLQKPMFEIWIPNLKSASYIKDVQSALKADPTLLKDVGRRKEAFRKIAKSVDNRYGEMAYNTLFWDRWVKDIGVGSSLSLGWNLGFLREYGGAAIDVGQIAKKSIIEGEFSTVFVKEAARTGKLDRALFVTFYTAQSLAYGGLLTWALTGQTPSSLMDYVFPKNGEKNPDGTDQRMNTMFYAREFMAIAKHMENEGVLSGMGQLVANKASPAISMITAWARGVDSYGNEINDPEAPLYKRLEQDLLYATYQLEPISIATINKQNSSGLLDAIKNNPKGVAFAVAGFSPAPKYITDTRTEAMIKTTFQKYYGAKRTPYEKAEYSGEARQLKNYYNSGDMEKYGELLDKMEARYELSPGEKKRLHNAITSDEDSLQKMFARLHWKQQQRILDKMTPEEREVYLPHSNKDHLRNDYIPPEERQ